MGDSWDRDAPPHRGDSVDVKEEPLPPAVKTTTRPPLAPPDRGASSSRKRSRSSEGARERRGNEASSSSATSGSGLHGGAGVDYSRANGAASTGGGFTTPSSRLRETATSTPPLAMTPLPSPSQAREPVVYKDVMLSDSEWEREIAEFGRQLDDMLARVSDRQLVAQTAQYMRAYPHHSLRFQIKIKQRALTDSRVPLLLHPPRRTSHHLLIRDFSSTSFFFSTSI